ncbi:MAG: nucleotide exchange factor GrpE [Gammaproteobacteria bacterium]|nr:nucleotide exchange factor GrpE [Gammaproteobacteria bacterium]
MVTTQQDNEEIAPEAEALEGELLEESEIEDGQATEDKAGPGSESEQEESGGPEQEIELLKKQLQESQDKAVRAQAELDNVRKRTLRDVENAHKYALDKFANELLPVLDSMEMGIGAADESEEQKPLKEGMQLTLKMFRDVMEKFGITEIEAEGKKFDPEKHEAVSMQEIEGSEAGSVVTVFQKGYALNGRLIRPAMVVVAK